MSREIRGFGGQRSPKPVEKIEVTEDKKKLRLALMLLFGALGIGLLTYAFVSWLGAEEGWQIIETNTSYGVTCGSDFTFQYYLGGSGVSATAQKKQLVKLYSQASAKAHQLFHETETFDGVANVAYINSHPGEVIEVEDALYQAFETILADGRRNLYLGPVYDQYRNFCSAQTGAEEFDPTVNEEMNDYFLEIASFANDPEQIDLELLGEGKVRLTLSPECQKYTKVNEITNWIDFYWTKNAFIIDYLAETVTMEGYTLGRISSVDGFARMLSENDTNRIALYDRTGNVVKQVGTITAEGAVSVVLLHDYPLGTGDAFLYGEREDGSLVSPYIDTADGQSRCSTDTMLFTSTGLDCGEMVNRVIPVFLAPEIETDALMRLADEGIRYAYWEEAALHSGDITCEFTTAD